MLQYNKLYQSLKKVSAEWHAGHVQWEYSWNYLKFYEDGTAIYVSSNGQPNELNWLDKDNKKAFFYKGNFNIQSNFKLEIQIPVQIGVLKFSGVITNHQLILSVTNQEMKLYENWDEYLIPNILV